MKYVECPNGLCLGSGEKMTVITAVYIPGSGVYGVFQCPNCFGVMRELIE